MNITAKIQELLLDRLNFTYKNSHKPFSMHTTNGKGISR